MYDQTKQSETKYSCVFYGFLHILFYTWGIKVNTPWILKFVSGLKYTGIIQTWGAVTGILYTYCLKRIKTRLGLSFYVQKHYISGVIPEGVRMGVGVKKLSTLYVSLAKDGIITKEELDTINNNKGYGHHLACKKQGEYMHFVDSYGNFRFKMLEAYLKYGYEIGLFYNPLRAIHVEDEYTRLVLYYYKLMRDNKYDLKKGISGYPKEDEKYIRHAGKLYRQDYGALL